MKRFILTLEAAVPVVRIEELHIWAKGDQCHRVGRGDNLSSVFRWNVRMPCTQVKCFHNCQHSPHIQRTTRHVLVRNCPLFTGFKVG